MKREWCPLFAAISTSERVATLGQACAVSGSTLSQDSVALFFTWMLPHCDPWGRIEASARVLRAKVWPMSDHTLKETEEAVAACVAKGLIEVLEDGSNLPWIQVLDWDAKAGSVGQLVRDRAAPKFPSKGNPVSTLRQPCANPSQSRAEESRTEQSRLPATGSPAAAVPVNGYVVPNTPHHKFIEFWMGAFLAAEGRAYGFDDKKDGAAVKAILKLAGGSLEVAQERALILLHAAPEWIDDGGRDLCTLRSQWNKLVSMGTGRTSGAKQLAIQGAMQPVPPTSGLLNMPTARKT